jgi:polyhydroxyalkanoate synthase subunit PhaE
MEPRDYMRELAALWTRGGAEFAAAQQKMFLDAAARMAKGMPGMAAPGVSPGSDSEALAAAGTAFRNLWASALDISGALTRALQKGEHPDPVATEMLGKIFDPRTWFAATDSMDEALNRLAEGPRLADLWDIERKFLAIFNAWVALRRRGVEHHTVMLEAWMQAAGAFARRLNAMADARESRSPRELMALWVETANAVMLETQRSDAYLQTQRELVKASTDLRLAQREVGEFYSEMFDAPTRAELDDVHRTVTDLKRELRALKRELREAGRGAPAPAPAAPARAEKPASRRPGARSKQGVAP